MRYVSEGGIGASSPVTGSGSRVIEAYHPVKGTTYERAPIVKAVCEFTELRRLVKGE